MPLYEITTKDQEAKRLVEADSSAQAVRHCATGLFTARTISKPTEIAQLMSKGVVLETAGAEQGAE
jgi:hypothetical protein